MTKRLYVGNLAFHSTEDSVRGAFQRAGVEPISVQVMTDRMTGQSRGFGFVEVGTDQEAQAAIEALHGQDVDGRSLTVNEARERTPGGGGGGGSVAAAASVAVAAAVVAAAAAAAGRPAAVAAAVVAAAVAAAAAVVTAAAVAAAAAAIAAAGSSRPLT